MNSLESMINKLSPLGVYNLSDKSINFAELAAFSIGLDILRNTLDEILKESFVATAEDYGLENLERLVGDVRSDLPLSKRRQMLTERLSLDCGDFTTDGFDSMLRLMGVEGDVEEYPFTQRIVLDVSGEIYNSAQREWIVSQTAELFPAHLEWDVVFAGFDWAESDRLNSTFAEIDSKGYVWKQIDYLI